MYVKLYMQTERSEKQRDYLESMWFWNIFTFFEHLNLILQLGFGFLVGESKRNLFLKNIATDAREQGRAKWAFG